MSQLGNTIRSARTTAKLSQKAAGQKCGVTGVYVNLIENNRAPASMKFLQAMATAFSLSLPDLIEQAISADLARAEGKIRAKWTKAQKELTHD